MCSRKFIFIFTLFSALRTGGAGWTGGTTELCSGRQNPWRRHCISCANL